MIIFDLDDTLIDTSGAITPYKLKECLKRMIAEGLRVPDFSEAYAELIALNAKCPKSKESISRFVHERGGGSQLIESAFEELTRPLPSDFVVPTTPHAKEILELFSRSHILALVTGGHPPFQKEKLKKAGIEPSFFSKIAIPEDSVKKPSYEGLIQEFSVSPSQVWVCGDRIAMDLLPGHELGFKTIHMRWGRGTIGETEKWIHYSISDLRELKGIIK